MSDARYSYFCPQCSSAMVSAVLLSEKAVCRACSWEGGAKELLAMPLGQGVSPDDLIKQLVQDLSTTFARDYGTTFARLLHAWGFLDQTNLQEEVTLYVKNAAGAMVASVLRTREQLELSRKRQADAHVQGKGTYDA